MSKESSQNLITALRGLAKEVDQIAQVAKFSDSWGWQALPMDKDDLSYSLEIIVKKLESVDWTENSNADLVFNDLASKATVARQNIVPQLFSGPQASMALTAFLLGIDLQIEAQLEPKQIRSSLSIPASLHKYAIAATKRLQSASTAIEGVEEKIKTINRAFDAAERLPATQDDIAQALEEIASSKAQADKLISSAIQSKTAATDLLTELELANRQAQSTLEKLEDTYRAATSQGLAKAFYDKAAALNKSMLLWVFVLVAALTAGGIIAHDRFPEILKAVTGKPDWGVVIINLVLGALSIAPTIWLAWVATKQIGQRFRLSEDYAYKAALSAAYEGYRSEAVRLDPLFEARLFSTALGRLDELPLRLVGEHIHGSPWHELLSSPEFKKAVEAVPDLKDRLLSILRPKKQRAANSDTAS